VNQNATAPNAGSPESILSSKKPGGRGSLGMAGSKAMRGGKITMATGKMSSKMSKAKHPRKGGMQLY